MVKYSNIKLNKALGQHFLIDLNVLHKIKSIIDLHIAQDECIVEVGPGAGALTHYLADRKNYSLIEYDQRWAKYLGENYPQLKSNIYNVDFLNFPLEGINNKMHIVGNFPYNISTQIIFKVLENKNRIPTVIGMFQKEVAMRICSPPNSKSYGILSVLTQAFYEAEYLFDVPKESFKPAPKVTSGVLILKRKKTLDLCCDSKFMKQIVKMAFNQRRKTLRNSLKQLLIGDEIKSLEIFDKRPEALDVDAFINLTNILDIKRKK